MQQHQQWTGLNLFQRRKLVLHKVTLSARVPGVQLEEHLAFWLAGLCGGEDAVGRQRQVRGVVQQGLREARLGTWSTHSRRCCKSRQ